MNTIAYKGSLTVRQIKFRYFFYRTILAACLSLPFLAGGAIGFATYSGVLWTSFLFGVCFAVLTATGLRKKLLPKVLPEITLLAQEYARATKNRPQDLLSGLIVGMPYILLLCGFMLSIYFKIDWLVRPEDMDPQTVVAIPSLLLGLIIADIMIHSNLEKMERV